MRVLIAEDDEYVHSAMVLALKRSGFTVDSAKTGTEAEAALRAETYGLVLLDLGLPGLDGTEVLRRLRSRDEDVPVIIVTARDSTNDRVNGLDLGANDYIVKPFDLRELEARIRAVLRKVHWKNKLELTVGALRLNTNSGQVFVDDAPVDLTPREASALGMLMSHAGWVVSKRQLMEQIYSATDDSTENAVEVIVHRLRKKLEKAGIAINTVRGFGYTLDAK